MVSKEAVVVPKKNRHTALLTKITYFRQSVTGDINAVRKNCKEKRFRLPTVSEFFRAIPSQNLKYHFVISVALTRLCPNNGMEMEQTFRLG